MRDPSEPDDRAGEPSLGDLLSQATRGLRRRWSDMLGPWNLSPHQARALRVITSGPQLRMTEIADALRIAPRSATEVVDGLEERGFVTRVADPSDRRAVLIRPTAEGLRVRAEVEAARREDAEAYFGRPDPLGRHDPRRFLGARLRGGLRRPGRVALPPQGHHELIETGPSFPDGLIVAICAAHGYAVATRKIRDFADAGIDVITPWSSP